jgi:hypothetical protein
MKSKNYKQSIVGLDFTDSILKEFFEKDGGIVQSGKIRKSYILASQWDLLFLQSIRIPEDHPLRSNSRFLSRADDRHYLAELLLFTSSIDLIARIMKKSTPKERGETNKVFFTSSARRWFGFSRTQSLALWEIRNQVVHCYSLTNSTTIYASGGSAVAYDRQKKLWKVNASGLLSRLIDAKNKCKKYISSRSLIKRHEYAKYIYDHGFFYAQ